MFHPKSQLAEINIEFMGINVPCYIINESEFHYGGFGT